MSPEHAEGELLDHRTDIFSLGIILFELLTGQRLFKGKSNAETIRRVKKGKVPLPSSLRESLPKELDKILIKTLSKDRDQRYQQAGLLREDLTKLLVSQYPEFKPEMVGDFIARLFAEETPTQKNRIGSMEISQTNAPKTTPVPEEPQEETGFASVAQIKKEMDDFLDELEPSILVDEEKTIPPLSFLKLPSKKFLQKTALCLFLSLFSLAGIRYGVPHVKEIVQKIKASPAVLTQPVPKKEESKSPRLKQPEPPTATAFLKIETTPPGATVFLNEVETKLISPTQIKELTPGKQVIGLHREGYKFWEQTVIAKNEGTVLQVTLQTDYGQLTIHSIPEGATVFLNGEEAGQTPFTREEVLPDSLFRIRVVHPDYEDWEQEVKVFAGRSKIVNAPLKKKPKKR
ncbi:MAG: PEGA domain-containing protein, partial [bacterium]|nr:PEGA domain-containing protein [bacterium]